VFSERRVGVSLIEEILKTYKGKIDKEIRVLGIDLGTTNATESV